MQYININDYLLLPVYLFAFYFIIALKSKKYAGTDLRKYCITAFFLHMLGSFLYCMVIQYFYGYGDSFGFYQGSNFIRKIISVTGDPLNTFLMSGKDFEKIYHVSSDSDFILPTGMGINSNITIMKISAVLSYISFNCYLIISMFFGIFAFTGLWRLYLTFNEITGTKMQKILAFAILYTPSICFWGSGLIKDSICLGAIGFICSYLYKIFIKKEFGFRELFFLLLFFYLLFTIKTYLATVLFLSLLLSYVLNVILKSKKNILKLAIVSFFVLVSSVIITLSLSSTLNSIIEDSKKEITTFKTVYANSDQEDERSMAGFSASDIEINLPNIILRSPLSLSTTLFRPFLWESRKPIIFFSALESLLMLLATLYVLLKCRVLKFFYYIFTDPYLLFCFTMTLLLGVIIGFSTFNFGSLVRYRLPILPFYFFMLLRIYFLNKAATTRV